MKKCPYCNENIQDSAIKCRWCGEFLSNSGKDDLKKKHGDILIKPQKENKQPTNKLIGFFTKMVLIRIFMGIPFYNGPFQSDAFKFGADNMVRGLYKSIGVYEYLENDNHLIKAGVDHLIVSANDTETDIWKRNMINGTFYENPYIVWYLVAVIILICITLYKSIYQVLYNLKKGNDNKLKISTKSKKVVKNCTIQENKNDKEETKLSKIIDFNSLSNGSDSIKFVNKSDIKSTSKNNDSNTPYGLIILLLGLIVFIIKEVLGN